MLRPGLWRAFAQSIRFGHEETCKWCEVVHGIILQRLTEVLESGRLYRPFPFLPAIVSRMLIIHPTGSSGAFIVTESSEVNAEKWGSAKRIPKRNYCKADFEPPTV